MTRSCSCDRLQARLGNLICRYFACQATGSDWPTGVQVAPEQTTQLGYFAGTSKDGSDGTRTRDLRRDRPSQAPRRLATNSAEWPHLQGFLTPGSTWHRMVEPIVQSTFGPRVGHENLTT